MTVEIRQITDNRGRRYEILEDGEKVTCASVTTILGALPKGDGLTWWGAKLALQFALEHGAEADDFDSYYAAYKATDFAPHRALKAAGARGTDVHNILEHLLKHGALEDLPVGSGADPGFVDALVKWHLEHSVDEWEMVAVEELLFSATHRYAGQVDLIAKRPDGVYVVGDAKTAKGIYFSHHLQAVAYEHAAREMGLIPKDAVVERHVIRLGVDGEYEVRMHPGVTIEGFLAVKQVHSMLKVHDKKGASIAC